MNTRRRFTRKNTKKVPFTKAQRAYINKTATAKVENHAEVKNLALKIANTSISATNGLIVDLTNIAQGDEDGQRIGLDIMPEMLTLRWEYIVATVGSDITNLVRITVFKFIENDSISLPTLATIFHDTVNERPLSPFDFVNNNTIVKILYDRIMTLNDSSFTNRYGTIKLGRTRLRGKRITYNNTLLTGEGKIYIVLWSDSLAVPHPTFKMFGHFQYTDG